MNYVQKQKLNKEVMCAVKISSRKSGVHFLTVFFFFIRTTFVALLSAQTNKSTSIDYKGRI